jgi:hypothetical protein
MAKFNANEVYDQAQADIVAIAKRRGIPVEDAAKLFLKYDIIPRLEQAYKNLEITK